MREKISKLIQIIRAYLPEGPPQSDAAMRAFALGVCQVGGFPENDSFLNAIATQFLHLDAGVYLVRKAVFIRALRRSIANQAAYGIMQQMKEAQKNAEAEAKNVTTA